jgi:hypothetical protein
MPEIIEFWMQVHILLCNGNCQELNPVIIEFVKEDFI